MNKGIVIPGLIYPPCVMVYKGDSCKAALKFYQKVLRKEVWEENKEKLEKEIIGDYMGGTLRISSGDVVIHLKESAGIPIAVHELFHAMTLIFLRLDVDGGDYPNEHCAYFLEYLVRETIKGLYEET